MAYRFWILYPALNGIYFISDLKYFFTNYLKFRVLPYYGENYMLVQSLSTMKKRNIIYWVLLFCVCLQNMSIAQRGQVSAGATSGTLSVSYGQVDYQTTSNGTYSLYQGVQQPHEISNITLVSNLWPDLHVSFYPNPTIGSITVEISNTLSETIYLQLNDIQGKELQQVRVNQTKTDLALNNYEAGTYYCTVKNSQNQLKTYKIIKQ